MFHFPVRCSRLRARGGRPAVAACRLAGRTAIATRAFPSLLRRISALPVSPARGIGVALALTFGLMLSACQSTGTEVLEEAAGPAKPQEVMGEGATRVAVLLPRSAGGGDGRRARDIQDGAAMALQDLGDGKLSLSVHDTGAGAGRIAALVDAAAGAKLILGPANGASAAALAAIGKDRRPSALAFTGNGEAHGNGVFAIATDAVDSALEAARIAAGAGRRSFVALVPQAFSQTDRARLERGLAAAKAQLISVIVHGGGNLAGQIAAERDTLVKADGVLIFGDGRTPATIAAALRTASALQPNAAIIGNLAWTSDNFSRPELDGALLAMPDQSGLALIADRFRTRTGRALTIDAAYGYDAVAVAAGIVRAMGPEALTEGTLTKSSGFRGATGIFRFMPDGSVERPLALYRLRGGALTLIDPPPEGF